MYLTNGLIGPGLAVCPCCQKADDLILSNYGWGNEGTLLIIVRILKSSFDDSPNGHSSQYEILKIPIQTKTFFR